MVSNSRPQGSQNSHDNVFSGLLVGTEEASLVTGYLAGHDFSVHTRRAIRNDLRKFVRWFTQANGEVFTIKRVTLRDVTDFRNSSSSGSAAGSGHHQSCVGHRFAGSSIGSFSRTSCPRIRPSK